MGQGTDAFVGKSDKVHLGLVGVKVTWVSGAKVCQVYTYRE